MPRLTPPLLVSGVFQLKPPFVVSAKTAYTVVAIRSFSEILSRGTDPMVLVYTPASLGPQHYQKDVEDGAMIVTLRSAQGEQIYVPDTYILSYPNMGDVNYAQTIVALSLGPLPVNTDLSALMADMVSLAKTSVGVDAKVRLARSTIIETVSSDEHVQLLSARRGNIVVNDDDSVRVRDLEAQVAQLQERIAVYQQFIDQNN